MTEKWGQEDQDMAGGEHPRCKGSWERGRSTAQGDSQTHLLQRPENVERSPVALPTRPRLQDTGSVTLTCLQGPSQLQAVPLTHTSGR